MDIVLLLVLLALATAILSQVLLMAGVAMALSLVDRWRQSVETPSAL